MGAMDELINPNLVAELRGIFHASHPLSTRRLPEWRALENSRAALGNRLFASNLGRGLGCRHAGAGQVS